MGVPHLIHIGFPKAGSTFLQEWFTRHPEICHTPGGIGGFRDLYGVCDFGANPRPPQTRCFVTSWEMFAMPITRTDLVKLTLNLQSEAQDMPRSQEQICALLRDLFPNGQILMVTRGFRGIIQSSYSEMIKAGGTFSPADLCALLAPSEFQSKTPQNGSSSGPPVASPFPLADALDFNFIIDLYERAFGAENMLVLPFELLRDDRTAFLAILEKRLGLSHVELDIGRLNPSLSPAELYWYPRISKRVGRIGNRLGPRTSYKAHTWQIEQIQCNRWRRAIKLLERRWPEKKVTSADFPAQAIEAHRGKADSLRSNPLYARYAADYLWEN